MNKIEKLQDQIDKLEAELMALDLTIDVMDARAVTSDRLDWFSLCKKIK